MRFTVFLLLFLIVQNLAFAGKTLEDRVDVCITMHNKTMTDVQNLASNLYALQKQLYPSEKTPFEILEKDVQKVQKGIKRLYKRTEKTLDRYEYYIDELEFEVEDVYECMDRSLVFIKKGVKSLDEAAFENYHTHLKKAHDHFLSSIEHLILYKERIISLKNTLYNMISKHQFTF